MDALDRWALHQTATLIRECTAACDAYEFHRVYQLCNQFCSVTLSATYHDILKDRLYTLGTNAPLRRSSQTAIHHIFNALVRLLAPIITFTADEAWAYATTKAEYANDSIHLQDWPVAPENWTLAGSGTDVERAFGAVSETEVDTLFRVRAKVNAAIEPLRAAGKLGKSLDAAVILHSLALAPDHRIQVEVVVAADSSSDGVISVRPAADLGHVRCPRCWRWVPALEKSAHGDVCPRCIEALKS
jgi:isoleucyl-tRNA synthetase